MQTNTERYSIHREKYNRVKKDYAHRVEKDDAHTETTENKIFNKKMAEEGKYQHSQLSLPP